MPSSAPPAHHALRNLPLVALLAMLALPATAVADGGAADAGPSIDEKVDADWPLTGEFSGPVAVAKNRYQPVAVQVRAIGHGAFEALQHRGGLPGERRHREQTAALIGKRHGDFLVLSGGPWAVFVEKDHCLLVDRQGERVGRLERVERRSPTLGAKPPKNAVVLFDGSGTEQFTNARMTPDGLLMEGADVRPMFQDYNLHLEFKLPYVPAARDQGRANSGVYLQSRYEAQILDSFAMPPVSNGCGGLYRFRAPEVNACLPPLTWQTYDIRFTAPRWASDGKKIRNARVTIWLNGIKVHDDVELPNKTGAGKDEAPTLLPIRLQNHGNPIRFRNIWLVDRGLSPAGRFPVFVKPDKKKPPAKEEKPKEEKPKEDAPKKESAAEKPKPEEAPAKPQAAAEKQPESKKDDAKPAAEDA